MHHSVLLKPLLLLLPPPQVENEEYQLKPMNCPFHVAMYKDGYFSYRDLPKRWAELGTVYRWEGHLLCSDWLYK
jgi:threonyl-tRNA synthetase